MQRWTHRAIASATGFSILEFSTWPLLHQFEATLRGAGRDFLVKPDGFIRIHESEEGTKGFSYDFFLEVDRSSESLDTLIHKACCYREFLRSGDYAKRCGAPASDIPKYQFRVLMVLKTAERRNNAAERLANCNPRILNLVWLTTRDEVNADPLGPIWITPADYREVTINTPFYNEDPNPPSVYRRRPEREERVESKIQKKKPLEG